MFTLFVDIVTPLALSVLLIIVCIKLDYLCVSTMKLTNLNRYISYFSSSLTVTRLQTTPHPTMWTLYSSLKNRPAASLLRRQLSIPLCPPCLGWIAPFWRWPTQTAPAASCLRCDQSGAAINCGARVLSSLSLSSHSVWPLSAFTVLSGLSVFETEDQLPSTSFGWCKSAGSIIAFLSFWV